MAYQSTFFPSSGSGSPYIDSLLWGHGWAGTLPITYSFNSGATYGAAYGFFSGFSWTASEINAVNNVFNSYSAVCNISFARFANNSSSSNLALWSLDSTVMGDDQGRFNVPDGAYAQLYGYFNYEAVGLETLNPGGLYYELFIHEIGHALGLAHPHDGGLENDATTFPGVTGPYSLGTYALNQTV